MSSSTSSPSGTAHCWPSRRPVPAPSTCSPPRMAQSWAGSTWSSPGTAQQNSVTGRAGCRRPRRGDGDGPGPVRAGGGAIQAAHAQGGRLPHERGVPEGPDQGRVRPGRPGRPGRPRPKPGSWYQRYLDPAWAAHPAAWHEAFPSGSPCQGRALLRQIHRLGLADISADAELDIVLPGTALAEFYRLSIEALCQSLISAGLRTADEAARLTARLAQPDFTGCGFAHIGAWGRRNDHPAG